MLGYPFTKAYICPAFHLDHIYGNQNAHYVCNLNEILMRKHFHNELLDTEFSKCFGGTSILENYSNSLRMLRGWGLVGFVYEKVN